MSLLLGVSGHGRESDMSALCKGSSRSNDWNMSHGERQFCDTKTMFVTMIVFSKPIVTSQRLVRELIIR